MTRLCAVLDAQIATEAELEQARAEAPGGRVDTEGCARCDHKAVDHDSAGCLACPGGWIADHSYVTDPQP